MEAFCSFATFTTPRSIFKRNGNPEFGLAGHHHSSIPVQNFY
ncbi:hypothetical protein B4098_0477 [Heyndrickxia coagulans]|uniref:Uncharacterized protein n=1 Tax=Heyndrickxia coagulans TaxID=1398 RepID=A0A150K143_HEYCO|nr:hypothetical protein B4098_0477 [Heyndrickxia coagulans]